MDIHLKTAGVLMMVLALVHIIFPRYFNWREELKPLSLVNRQMMLIHTFFIALVVFLMGLLCVNAYADLIRTHLGRQVCLGIGIFWAARFFIQFLGYSSQLWRGKRFETIVHIVFIVLWAYLSTVFLTVYLMQRPG